MKMMSLIRNGAAIVTAASLFIFDATCFSIAHADDGDSAGDDVTDNIGRKFSIGFGVGYESFNTNLKVTELSTGRDVFVDMEGTLGLPESDTIPMIYGYFRPSRKHGIGFSYFQVKRDGNLFALNENLGDLNVTGDVSLSDRTSFYYMSYNYTAYEDDRAFVFASLGLYGLDLEYNLTANGTLSFRDIPIASGQFERTIRT